MSPDEYQCPHCGHHNRVGVLICENCGCSTLDINITRTRLIERLNPDADYQTSVLTACRVEDAAIVLQIEGAKPISIQADKPVTLGRDSSQNPRRPDVDLSAFNAFEKGVSRFHALLGYTEETLKIADLGSANGTYIDDERLLPHRSYPLENGDRIRLAKLAFRVEVARR